MIGVVWGVIRSVPLWVWLSAALAGSLWGNYRQFRDALQVEVVHEQALNTAVLQGQITALAGRADALDLQGRQLAADAQALLDSLGVIHEQEQTQLTTWRGFVRRLPPLPTGCGPGPERVDGFNSVMRSEP